MLDSPKKDAMHVEVKNGRKENGPRINLERRERQQQKAVVCTRNK